MGKTLSYWEDLLRDARYHRQLLSEVVDRYDGVQHEPIPSKWEKRGSRWMPADARVRRYDYDIRLRRWREAKKMVADYDKRIAYYETRIETHPLKTAWAHVLAGANEANKEESRAARRAARGC